MNSRIFVKKDGKGFNFAFSCADYVNRSRLIYDAPYLFDRSQLFAISFKGDVVYVIASTGHAAELLYLKKAMIAAFKETEQVDLHFLTFDLSKKLKAELSSIYRLGVNDEGQPYMDSNIIIIYRDHLYCINDYFTVYEFDDYVDSYDTRARLYFNAYPNKSPYELLKTIYEFDRLGQYGSPFPIVSGTTIDGKIKIEHLDGNVITADKEDFQWHL